jgi:signal transduction histidine kinase/DNA-binding response OmpR family regulator
MALQQNKFLSQVPELNLAENAEMLADFSREAQRHLISARNSLLVLESVSTDKEAIENIFRTFHTIRGLADFLNLADIRGLTQESETMLNLVRKNSLSFDGGVSRLTARAINDLQKLLELLDEQISNEGKLTSPYHNVSEVISEIYKITSSKPTAASHGLPVSQILPTISFEPDITISNKLEDQIKSGQAVDKGQVKELLTQFNTTVKELKEVQSKLQERQRELIKERELALKLTKQAQSEARGKSEYLANMSHEIRTLINAILGFTELLRESPLNIKQKDHLNTIILSGKMLLEIVNDILDYSKVEAGKLKLESIDFNIEETLTEVFTIIRSRLAGKPINLFFDVDKSINPWLVGDPTRIKQIFINLLENAIKFTERGEIGITVRPEKSIVSDGQTLRFIASDTGIGIPEDRKAAIFESYTQADSSTTRLYGGTGLGLTLCKNFVEKMGGKLWVETQLGKGSQFIFTIPFKNGKASTYKHPEILPEGIQNKQIIVVDGHDRSAESLLAICQSLKVKTISRTQNARQAIEIILQHKEAKKPLPELIFIDLMPADKESFNFAYKLKQQDSYREIKLVAVSADVRVDSSDDFRQVGFDDFLAKPIIKKELANLLLRVFHHEVKERRPVEKNTVDKISCEGIRILVAEDSAPNQELLKVHFESLGCICEYVGNGQEAVEKIQKTDFDVCFMDLQMPVMGGLEATKIIRTQLKKTVPIIALTAAEIEEEKDKCLKAGMNDYLPKPFDLMQLKEKIIRSAKM